MGFLNVLVKDILGTPAILVGLFALAGLLLQKTEITKTITGTLKTVMGFIILAAGATIVSTPLGNFSEMFGHAFHLRGIVPNTDVMSVLAQSKFGTLTAIIMVGAMLFNIFLARFTKLKYIFLTGHLIMYMAAMLAFILAENKVGFWLSVIIGLVIEGLWMIISPAILQKYTRQITGNDELALGHFGSLVYLLSAWIGKLVGKKDENRVTTEDIRVPKQLGFLRDSSVAIMLTMTVFFLITAFFAGKPWIETKLSSGQNFIVFSFLQAVTFAAGVFVILAGVRMIIAEIVPAFKGIADKVVPGARAALDCPTVFPFAPNAVIIGFLSAFFGGLCAIPLTPMFGLSVIAPGLVPIFFCGGTAGVYGNKTGGLRGAIIGPFIVGIVMSFLPAIFLIFTGQLGYATTWGDADFNVIGIILSWILGLFH